MCICVHGTSCLCILSASAFVHWAIPTCTRFLFRSLYEYLFLYNNVTCAAHALVVDVLSSHVCTDKWLSTASTLCPLNLPHKKAQAVSPSYGQSKAQMDQNFVTIGGCSNVTHNVLWRWAGWRKKNRMKKMNKFWLLTFWGLPLLKSYYTLLLLL